MHKLRLNPVLLAWLKQRSNSVSFVHFCPSKEDSREQSHQQKLALAKSASFNKKEETKRTANLPTSVDQRFFISWSSGRVHT